MINLTKEAIFIGDLHGNLDALEQILTRYESHHKVFLGDFFNDKAELCTVPEVDKIVETIHNLPDTTIVHSNHNQLVIQALEARKPLDVNVRGWNITQQYINTLGFSRQERLKHWLSSHPVWEEFRTVNGLTIAAAHAYPNTAAEKYRKGKYLTEEQKSCVGIKTPHRWWSNRNLKGVLLNWDAAVIGHYAHISIKERLVIADLGGYQIPVWDPQMGKIKVF
jgi:hypothetical protein